MTLLQHKKQITAIHHWTKKQRESADNARNSTTDAHKKAMLGGKVNAYTNVLCLIQDKYGKYLPASGQ